MRDVTRLSVVRCYVEEERTEEDRRKQKCTKEHRSGADAVQNRPHSELKQDSKHLFRMSRKPTDGTDQRCLFFTRSLPLIAVCWLILLLIVGLRIHFTNVISENEAKLTAEIQQLKSNSTGQPRDTETNLNVSRAQWSVDAYCPKSTGRRCQPCQNGWNYFQSSCYVMLHPDPPDWKNWEEARENCRGRNSDLVFIDNAAEKSIISHYSWGSSGTDGHWIGLRVEDGGWKWVDGSDLNETSWIDAPADGHCGVSVTDVGWRSVSCSNRNRWSCKKKALSV
ncbi:killer cell lectin-like receptor subfamily G member 1 [Cebidichthys violaceus]|uniref:killer cell lectin-like receptor subfamily G member 1 n=1 Tax=Cebidichthys violaceus TaxID=271503 RepID=UPI0035C94AC5